VFRVFSTALLYNEIYLPTNFHVDISYSFRVMSLTKFKYKSEQRAITPIKGKTELWLFRIAF
jgi:hypothetical protein